MRPARGGSQFDSRAAEQSDRQRWQQAGGSGMAPTVAGSRRHPAPTARRCLSVLRTREVRLPEAIPDPPACCIITQASRSVGFGTASLRAGRSCLASMIAGGWVRECSGEPHLACAQAGEAPAGSMRFHERAGPRQGSS